MIRREIQGPGGTPRWMLISQVDHARISSELAATWGRRPFAAVEPREELLAAILHHDDGWAAWERVPGVDPTTGRPRDFTEMPIEESLVIWSESIRVAAQYGPLAGYVVSRHFSILLRSVGSGRELSSAEGDSMDRYRAARQADEEQYLAAWRRAAGESGEAEAERGLECLRFFDLLSLWLCCADRDAAISFETPGGPMVQFSPGRDGEVTLAPWPLKVDGLGLSVSGRGIAQRSYRDAADLAAEPSATVSLAWSLVPSES